MPSGVFQKRLLRLKDKFGLTLSDLAFILGVRRVTISSWAMLGRQPREYKMDRLNKLLTLVEGAEKHFPIPLSVSQNERHNYIAKAINVRAPLLSKQGASK